MQKLPMPHPNAYGTPWKCCDEKAGQDDQISQGVSSLCPNRLERLFFTTSLSLGETQLRVELQTYQH